MIKIDFKNFFRDRIWFGWWYRDWVDEEDILPIKWCRDPNPKYHWIIKDLYSARVFDDD